MLTLMNIMTYRTIWFMVVTALVALALVGVVLAIAGSFSDVTYVADGGTKIFAPLVMRNC